MDEYKIFKFTKCGDQIIKYEITESEIENNFINAFKTYLKCLNLI